MLNTVNTTAIAFILFGGTGASGATAATATIEQVQADCWEDAGHLYCAFDGTTCDVESGATMCETLAALLNFIYGTSWVADGVECRSGTLCSFHSIS